MSSAQGNLHVTVLGTAVLLVVAGVAWFGLGGTDPVPSTPQSAVLSTEEGLLAVHVSGEVLHPGLVMVPAGSRLADALGAAGGITSGADLTRVNLAAVLRDGEHIVVASIVDGPSVGEEPSGVDINTATAAELESLPGVGPVLAARIVAFREDHGPFTAVEDLLDVPGIGEAKLSQLREAIASP